LTVPNKKEQTKTNNKQKGIRWKGRIFKQREKKEPDCAGPHGTKSRVKKIKKEEKKGEGRTLLMGHKSARGQFRKKEAKRKKSRFDKGRELGEGGPKKKRRRGGERPKNSPLMDSPSSGLLHLGRRKEKKRVGERKSGKSIGKEKGEASREASSRLFWKTAGPKESLYN